MRVFMPLAMVQYEGISELEQIVYSQVTIVTAKQLEANPEEGKGIKVAFYVIHRGGELILEYKEKGLLPDLGLICNHGVGVNHMPFDKLRSLGIRLANTPDVLSDSTADMALALMLASGRRLKLGMEIAMNLPSKEIHQASSKEILGNEISYAKLGIIGMGSIGYKVAQRAKAFNMSIHYHNRSQRSAEEEKAIGATFHAELHSLLSVSDYLVVSCPLTSETKNLIGREEFKAMKSTAHLINVARGSIVNTDALVEALVSKEIHAAALDVTEPEPLPNDHPILKLENVIIVPHWGSATIETRGKMLQLMIDNGKAFIESKPLLTEVTL
ncbi:glyoxylate/hydroxypyruvate reductase B-like [Watersipora subatra]|uniref:glyoxylate/hydroxypyruvate reductase B-like n=1 Tax=Watersipora subatra TaxID=2589382 RepID=UPI00355BCF85